MADENRGQGGQDQESSTSKTKAEENTGDPGRTPGAAEGDRETVEEDLKDKENQGQL